MKPPAQTSIFQDLYLDAPSVAAKAPGRINLIGDHIDYLGGIVLPMAIDVGIEILAAPDPGRPGAGRGYRFWSDSQTGDVPLSLSRDALHPETGTDRSWLNYPAGVLAAYQAEGIVPPPFAAAVFSALPHGAGLSSSAALCTAVALVIERLSGVSLGVAERARLCQRAEHQFAGVPCGIMDQLAIGGGMAGHAVRIDCRDETYEPVPLPGGIAIVVADTKVHHRLGSGQYRARREDCERATGILGVPSLRDAAPAAVEGGKAALGDVLYRRARHAVGEMGRVEAFIDALRDGDLPALGELMAASHRSLRDDFEVSCPELDCLVDAANAFGPERGFGGARMTGGGFGGSTVNLVERGATDAFLDHLRAAARSGFGNDITPFVATPSAGATSSDLAPDSITTT